MAVTALEKVIQSLSKSILNTFSINLGYTKNEILTQVNNLDAKLVKAIQDQQIIIDGLKSRIETLESLN